MTQRVKEGFSFDFQGVPVTLRAGQLFADDHPYVQVRADHFEPAGAAATRSPARAVETATADPASRRVVSRKSGHDVDVDKGTTRA